MRLTGHSGFPARWEIHCTSTPYRSGRLVFATSLLTFTSRFRLPGLQGLPVHHTASRPRPRNLYPRGLGLPFRALGVPPAPALAAASSLEIRGRPSTVQPSRVHSQQQAAFGLSSTKTPGHVPPSWFPTTSTACSTRWLVGLLHPTTGLGVHCVSPQRGSHPPKSLPRQQPHRVATAVALLLLPPPADPGTEAPLPRTRR
jgi:hypothetical protein